MTAEQTAAVAGLGLIGSEWARHLEADGVLRAVWNRSPRPNFTRHARPLGELPKTANIIHIVVGDEKAASSVIDQLLPGLSKNHLIVQSTTIDPATSSTLKQAVESRGAAYLEAPFTGSLPAAQARKVTFYLGGDAAAISAADAYLGRLSDRRFVIGSNLQACTLKLAMNLQISAIAQVLFEALTVARGAGISDEVFFDAMRANASWSGVAALKEQKLRGADYSPQFSTKHMHKDMRLLSGVAGDKHLPILEAVRSALQRGIDSGFGDEDFSSIIKLLERN